MTPDIYQVGDVVPLTFEVRDPGTDTLVDPSTWALELAHEGTPVTAPALTHPAIGRFEANFVPTAVGVWAATFTTSGAFAGVVVDQFVVQDDNASAVVTLADLRTYLGASSATDADILAALAAERVAQSRTCFVDPYGADLREALLRRVGRNLAARRAPIAQVNSFTKTSGGVSTVQLDAEIARLEGPYRRPGFA